MIPISGAVSLSQVRTELGLAGAMSMEQLKVRRLAGKSSGAVSGSDLRGATYIRANVSSGLLLTQAGSAARYRYVIDPAIWVYGVYGVSTEALTIGSHPAGSSVILDNYGAVVGHAGISSGQAGREAVYVPWGGPVTINNYGTLFGGGGAGGQGGAGGYGGGGYYTSTVQEGAADDMTNDNYHVWRKDGLTPTRAYINWQGTWILNGTNLGYEATSYYDGSYTYYRGNLRSTTGDGKGGYHYYYGIYRTYQQTYYTNGGAGGAGGAGGRGKDASGSAAGGSAGTGGSPGGTNAGTGGQGGTGGTGGDWGAPGAQGITGYSGSNGNNGSGLSGQAGSPGGAAGYYLYRSTPASCTINDYGWVAGRLQ